MRVPFTTPLEGSPQGKGEALPRATFTTPLRTVRQALNPPSTDIQSTPYTAAGVDTASPDEGLVTRSQVTDGRWYRSGATDEVLLNVSYAKQHSLGVGQTEELSEMHQRSCRLLAADHMEVILQAVEIGQKHDAGLVETRRRLEHVA